MSSVRQRALPVEERVEPAAGVARARSAAPGRGRRAGPDRRAPSRGRRGRPRSPERRPAAGAVADEDQRQHRGQEQDQVVLVAALQRREHLPQHEQPRSGSTAPTTTRSSPGESRRPGRSSSYSAISSSASTEPAGGASRAAGPGSSRAAAPAGSACVPAGRSRASAGSGTSSARICTSPWPASIPAAAPATPAPAAGPPRARPTSDPGWAPTRRARSSPPSALPSTPRSSP